jgi:hypothetical protein
MTQHIRQIGTARALIPPQTATTHQHLHIGRPVTHDTTHRGHRSEFARRPPPGNGPPIDTEGPGDLGMRQQPPLPGQITPDNDRTLTLDAHGRQPTPGGTAQIPPIVAALQAAQDGIRHSRPRPARDTRVRGGGPSPGRPPQCATWRLRLERAGYEVERARRCYRLAEPENRLVVRQLEADWEQALADRQRLEEDYRRFQATAPPMLTEQDKAAITATAADLPGLWRAPTTTDTDRKQIIRSVIDEVTVTVRGRSELVDLTICWAGAQHTTAVIRRPIQRLEDLSYYSQLTARIAQLADTGLHPEHIADRLTAEGWRSARDDGPIRHRAVFQILRRTGHLIAYKRAPLPVHPDDAPRHNEWWLPALAAELGVTTGTIRRWREQGRLTGRQETRPPHRWILHADPAQLADLRAYLNRIKGRTTRVHPRFAEEPDSRIP